jgi:hypothetical protein
MREQQAGEDEYTGEPADDHVYFHTLIPSRHQRKSYKPIADGTQNSLIAFAVLPDEPRNRRSKIHRRPPPSAK